MGEQIARDRIVLEGRMGPNEVKRLQLQLLEVCAADRPWVELDLTRVTSAHIALANTIMNAQRSASRRLGTVVLNVADGSEAHHMLARTGLIDRMR